MKGRQFRKLIESLDLNQVEVARLLDTDARTIRRWALDEYEVPSPAARLLVLLSALKETGQLDWATQKLKGAK
jgi:DNA-binding transcriptional regulator YiaG